MKVGEVTFFYLNQPPLTCLYVTETQRLAFVQEYRTGTTYYTIIPYTGCGMPNMVNTKRKWYATDLTAAARLHRESQGMYERGKAHKEWCSINELNQLNIRAA